MSSKKKSQKRKAVLKRAAEAKKDGSTAGTDSAGALRTLIEANRSYLFSWSVDRLNWKFNKARQNWLIKHLFSEVHVPKPEFKIVVKYLNGLPKGTAREAVIKRANALIEEGKKATAKEEEANQKEEAKSKDSDESAKEETEEISEGKEETSTTKEEVDTAKQKEAETKATGISRAKVIIKRMGQES